MSTGRSTLTLSTMSVFPTLRMAGNGAVTNSCPLNFFQTLICYISY